MLVSKYSVTVSVAAVLTRLRALVGAFLGRPTFWRRNCRKMQNLTPEQWAGLNKPELAQAMAGMVTMVQTSQQQVGQLSAAVQQLTSKPAAPPVSRTIMSKPAPKDKLTLGKMSGASKAHNLLVWFMNTDV